MTSLQGPWTPLGKNFPISASMGSIFTLSRKPCGDFTSMKARMRSATCVERIDFQSQVHAASGAELVDQDLRAGMALDVFKKQGGAAGPSPAYGSRPSHTSPLLTRSVISVISRTGSTSVRMVSVHRRVPAPRSNPADLVGQNLPPFGNSQLYGRGQCRKLEAPEESWVSSNCIRRVTSRETSP